MKVIIGLSGGVDSSVAALLLKQQGYEVEGCFMRNWDSALNNDQLGNPNSPEAICPQEQDYLDAKRVADQLDIRLIRHDFIQEYWDDVFRFFLDELAKGRTPNPDILCNKYIKFQAFIDIARSLGADKIAMGHFARTRTNEKVELLRGVDANKDQTYFLCQLTQEQLKDTLFPVGHLTKAEVRKLAVSYGLATAKKKDSTGICFIGERRFSQFLSNYLPAKPGNIVTLNRVIIGRHDGLMNYTLGQRKGLRIGGDTRYSQEPWYVSGKDLTSNELFVVQGFHHDLLYSDRSLVKEINWISGNPPDSDIPMTAKFRYRQKDVEVSLESSSSGETWVRYPSRARAVTPGQACVFYQGDRCLGGGTIDMVFCGDETRGGRLPNE
ncbi:MAG: tRNA 2-thiouridine(34) synthase MnmA [Candidatus Izemoplasmatales bacterium]|jgi:tRNA-specific 2-thiouridylase|nr:tRNA 2-thiouridine(34) synthase MnmA [Candidatus Izemoplasmatales bacterium]MDD4988289.1 tRNA 2-thiouridine(34) synthase MnmA [Candidatus Izemoplasmatales bacterium]MDD5601723.1 tRNA 2-thiouridine(34) synthase MnmA [Candidatus Izemoplasmatales bacterium]